MIVVEIGVDRPANTKKGIQSVNIRCNCEHMAVVKTALRRSLGEAEVDTKRGKTAV